MNRFTSELAKLREKAAKNISANRNGERAQYVEGKPHYVTFRDSLDYALHLHGYEKLFSYAKSINGKILGLGEGQGIAIKQFAQTYSREGLQFFSTTLRNPNLLRTNANLLSGERIRQTSAEVLRGFKKESISVVIANFSLAYAEPTLSISRINEVLVPGGVVKATFNKTVTSKKGLQTADEFIQIWRSLGYDIAERRVHDYEEIEDDRDASARTIVVAVKPGGKAKTSALHLLVQDETEFFKLHPLI